MNKKKLLILAALPLLLTACDGQGGGNNGEEIKSYHHEEKTFEKTNTKIFDFGTSDYTIVTSNNPSDDDKLARDELVYLVNLATGITLPTITTNQIVDSSYSNKYISLGVNDYFNTTGINIDDDKLLESGYVMKTIENSVFIAGSSIKNRMGTLYGVYDFLHYTIGYEYYAKDCIYFDDNLDEVYLPIIDVVEIPSFPTRIDNVYSVYRDATNNRRLRFCQESTYWVSFTHTLIGDYITPGKYFATHPEYFAKKYTKDPVTGKVSISYDTTQICWSDPGCFEAVCQEVLKDIRSNPDQNLVMLGHGDYWPQCDCPDCLEKKSTFDGWGGVELDFTNRVAAACDEALANEGSTRKITYVFFAYNPSFQPPIDVPTPYVYKNTGVLLAPIQLDFAKSINDRSNENIKASMNVWKSYFDSNNNDNIFVWTYALYCRQYMTPFPNWTYFQEYYRYFESLGAKLLYDQGNYDANQPCFQNMRAYIASKTSWDTTYNYEDLVDDFMIHYYGPVATEMKNFFNFQRAFYQNKFDNSGSLTGAIMDTTVMTKQHWSFEYLNSEILMLENILKSLDYYMYTEIYQTYYDRVCNELIGPYYLMLNLYLDQINKDTAINYCEFLLKYLKKFNISAIAEHGASPIDQVKEWRDALAD